MALRMQMSRPVYITRPLRPLAARAPAGGARGTGRQVGAAGAGGLFPPIDQTPTGNWGGDLAKAISNIIELNRQNALANRLMNTENPPRAALVTNAAGQGLQGVPGANVMQGGQPVAATPYVPKTFTPDAGVSLAGTYPTTGGLNELRFQQQVAADAGAQRQAQLAEAINEAKLAKLQQGPDEMAQKIKQAQLENLQARTKALQAGKQGGKPAAYVAGSSTPDDASYYDFNHQRDDFDAQYGKGSYNRLLANSNLISQDPT